MVKGAVEILKRPDVDAHEVSARLLELQGLMIEAQLALGDAQEEIRSLKQKLSEHDETRALRDDLEFVQDGGFYRRKSESAQGLFNPYCPVCWGDRRKAIPLAPLLNGFYTCAIHKTNYQTSAAREEQQRLDEQRRADENAIAIFPKLIR